MWTHIEITDLDGISNKYNQYLFGTCLFCKAPATKILSRTYDDGVKTRRYNDIICQCCSQSWETLKS
jgi:hypothetical protein